jgi:hypothetical protein
MAGRCFVIEQLNNIGHVASLRGYIPNLLLLLMAATIFFAHGPANVCAMTVIEFGQLLHQHCISGSTAVLTAACTSFQWRHLRFCSDLLSRAFALRCLFISIFAEVLSLSGTAW